MSHSILIIGEDPSKIDFSAADAPPNMSAEKVMQGLTGSRDRLRASGHVAEILLTDGAATVTGSIEDALRSARYDVIVIGAGLRVIPAMAEEFEILINAVHRLAPDSQFAFNESPEDSDIAALRQLSVR